MDYFCGGKLQIKAAGAPRSGGFLCPGSPFPPSWGLSGRQGGGRRGRCHRQGRSTDHLGTGAAPGSPGQVRLCWHGGEVCWEGAGMGRGHPTPWDGKGPPACPLWTPQFGIQAPLGEKRGVRVGEALLPPGKQIWERLKSPQPTGCPPALRSPGRGSEDWLLSLQSWQAMGQPSKPTAAFSKEEVEK